MSDTNTTHPYQPGYVRPDPHPDDSFQPFQVTARAVATGDTAAERAHSTMVNALDGYEEGGVVLETTAEPVASDGTSMTAMTDACVCW